tara:strand:+ start:1700 stop:4015 length:2316 start_codon:yes stop_codon:yes gene_type:complete
MGDDKMVSEFQDKDQRYAVCMSYADRTASIDVEAKHGGQHGRPGPNDPRKTPAKPSERRKGSKKNPPGSAKKPNKNIQMSKETETKIRNMMEEHNKKVKSKGKGNRASMGALKTVFRRGAGAFSRSHAPNMSRTGWGLARVRAFLYLMRMGRPSNPNYKQDNDLLPKSHPKANTEQDYQDWDEEAFTAAEYQGRKVTLNKPFRTPKESKKFAVYTKNESGKVVIVRFGDPNMEIKRDDPDRRKNFRSRHNCDNPGPKWKARYWSCKMWERGKSVTQLTSGENMEEYEEFYEAEDKPCCNSCAGESVEARMIRKDVFDNPGEAAERAKEIGCEGIHTHSENGDTIFMPCESHDEYEQKTGEKLASYHDDEKEAGYKDDDEMKASYHTDGGCRDGYKKEGNMCVPIAVTCEITVESINAVVEASTGKTVYRISGVAFHSGLNKNNWALTREGAEKVVAQMKGADLTLYHPSIKSGRFTRNMSGTVDEAVVGLVTEASISGTKDVYVVNYVADVYREELFSSLDSGLWLRADYGVSIGGTGVPEQIIESEEGRPQMYFGSDFKFDHLAIVHKPAYPNASIDTAEKIEVEQSKSASASETFKGDSDDTSSQSNKVILMADENNNNEAVLAEIESLKAEAVLREARIAEFEAAEMARIEAEREGLVAKASELGLKGHEDFSVSTLKSVIASWESSRPEPVTEVKMEEATPAASEPAVASEQPKSVVANYLNGELLETDEDIYSRAYNAWASAYNKTIDMDSTPALKYEELKKMEMI